MKIMFDTSVLIALNVESDHRHSSVKNYVKQQIEANSVFYVTDYVLDEYFTRMLYDYGAKVAKHCVGVIEKQIENASLSMISIAPDLFMQSKRLFLNSVSKKVSFTDASTYVVYDRYRMDEICTLDSDFRKLGARLSMFPV